MNPTYQAFIHLLRPLTRLCARLVSIRGVKLRLDPRAMVTQ